MSEEKRKIDAISGGAEENQAKKPKISDDLAAKVKAQMEFYFSDSNFPKDKFLRANSALNEEGYVSLDTILTFKRMKELCTDREIVVSLLKDSTVVKVNPEGTMVKRIAPLPEKDPMKDRTIYAEGFLPETTFEEIQEFFQKHAPVNSVRLIKDKENHKPTGSAFIEFSTPEKTEEILTKTFKFNDKELVLKKKADYLKQSKPEEKKSKKEKKEGEEEKGEKGEEGEEKKEKKERGGKKDGKREGKKEKEFPKGAVLHIADAPEVPRESVKEIFAKFGTVAFVEQKNKEKVIYVRFENEGEANKALDFKDKIGDAQVTLRVLEGEEEKNYWAKFTGGKKGGKGGKGGKKFGRKKKF